MNLFQWLTVPILLTLALLEIRANFKNHQAIHFLRLSIWMTGLVLVLFPGMASAIAGVLGIGRGTDLVFYTFMLLSTGGMFYLYGRNYLLRRDLVELARREAIRGATPGTSIQPNLSGAESEMDARVEG
ncbi:MAG: DUF2304 domain-containing protein [Planctomycetota bacterium]